MADVSGENPWPPEVVDFLTSQCDALEVALRDIPERIGDGRKRAACRRVLWHAEQQLALMRGQGNPADRAMVDFSGRFAPEVIAYCGSEASAVTFMIGAARFAMRMGLTIEDLVLDEIGQDSA